MTSLRFQMERSVDEVYDALLKNNLQPVMSDYIYV